MTLRIEHPSLNELYAYWDRKRGERPAPTRADIDPVDIPHLLSNIFICQVAHEPRDYIIRLFGTALVEGLGRDLTGKRYSEIFPADVVARIHLDYDAVVEKCAAVTARKDASWSDKSHLHYELLLLPLSDDGKTVNRIVGAAYRLETA
jgi:hypothetical protein